jgi:lipoate-protein ligase A
MAYDFRLIYDRERDGAANMARDEAISRVVSASAQPPTLRLYGWAPPAISLGQSQRVSSVDEVKCRAEGVGIVRRPTGGLAILHTDELTYSVALPIDHPIAEGDVMTSYSAHGGRNRARAAAAGRERRQCRPRSERGQG